MVLEEPALDEAPINEDVWWTVAMHYQRPAARHAKPR